MCRRLPSTSVVSKSLQRIEKRSAEGNQEWIYSFTIELRCRRAHQIGTSIGTAFAPRFPKIKDESWWIMIGNVDTEELLALKRMSLPDNTNVKTRLKFHSISENIPSGIQLHIISDCYLGLNQVHGIFN